ncbi:MAG: hypothetical protein WCS38_08740 [Mesotoga sp.]
MNGIDAVKKYAPHADVEEV